MNWFPFTYILDNLITNSIHAWLTKDYRSSGMPAVIYILPCLVLDISLSADLTMYLYVLYASMCHERGGTPYILYYTYARTSRVWFLACFVAFKGMLFIVYCPFLGEILNLSLLKVYFIQIIVLLKGKDLSGKSQHIHTKYHRVSPPSNVPILVMHLQL